MLAVKQVTPLKDDVRLQPELVKGVLSRKQRSHRDLHGCLLLS